MQTESERLTSLINSNFFFKEFCYQEVMISSGSDGEIELADLLITFSGYLLVFQLKERKKNDSQNATTEENWFKNKVLNKAKQQVYNSFDNIMSYETLTLTNNRSHKLPIRPNEFCKIFKIIIFDNDQLGNTEKYLKGIESSKVGFIHLLSLDSYRSICELFCTPTEIIDYFLFRESIGNDSSAFSENALLGYYLKGDYTCKLNEGHRSILEDFKSYDKNNRIDFIIRSFYDRITGEISLDYYKIIEMIAMLGRNALYQFDKCFSQAFNDSFKPEHELPYRFSLPTLSCGFVFIPWPYKMNGDIELALANFTRANKYDAQLQKCVGVIIKKDGDTGYFDILWCLLDYKWEYNSDMENHLKNAYPFRKPIVAYLPKY